MAESSANLLAVAAIAAIAACGANAKPATVFPLDGAVETPSFATFDVPLRFYGDVSHPRADGLEDELRIRDSSGRIVPYLLRDKRIRTTVTTTEWRSLQISGIDETNGTLSVEVSYPENAPVPESFCGLKISTPLRDFEESVKILSPDGAEIATGAISDHHRFADVRTDKIAFDVPFLRRFTVVFANAENTVADTKFERTQTRSSTGDANDEASSEIIRRELETRAFRIDGLSVGIPRTTHPLKPAQNIDCPVRAQPRVLTGEKATVFEFDAACLPTSAIRIEAQSKNYFRSSVTVGERIDHGWRLIANDSIRDLHLGGKEETGNRIPFQRAVRAEALQVKIIDGDNGPLPFGDKPIVLEVTPREVVFLAEPGMHYEAFFESGATRPRYDTEILGRSDIDPVAFTISGVDGEFVLDAGDGAGSWLDRLPCSPITIASVLVFAILAIIACRLLK